MLYGHQANWLGIGGEYTTVVSTTQFGKAFKQVSFCGLYTVLLQTSKQTASGYRIKPHGQLVLVSFIHY